MNWLRKIFSEREGSKDDAEFDKAKREALRMLVAAPAAVATAAVASPKREFVTNDAARAEIDHARLMSKQMYRGDCVTAVAYRDVATTVAWREHRAAFSARPVRFK